MRCHEVDYEIIGNDMQLVEVELDPQESVIAEAGALSWTFELRPVGSFGFEAPPDQIRPCGEEMLPAALLLAERSALPLRVEFPDGLPESVASDAPAQLAVQIVDGIGTLAQGTVRIHFANSAGSFTAVGTPTDAEGRFTVNLPPMTCGQQTEFYVEGETTGGRTVVLPGANAPFVVISAETVVLLADDAESDLGWSLGVAGDTATAGVWERADPEQTPIQPEDDTSPDGTLCFVTGSLSGSHYNDYDVDGDSQNGQEQSGSECGYSHQLHKRLGAPRHARRLRWCGCLAKSQRNQCRRSSRSGGRAR